MSITWSSRLQAEEKEVADKQAQNRAKLRQEERNVHKFQKEQVSLNSALSDKRAELEALQRTADPEQLEQLQTEMATVERSNKQHNAEVASLRERLSNLQARQEQEQEVLDALQRRLVRSRATSLVSCTCVVCCPRPSCTS